MECIVSKTYKVTKALVTLLFINIYLLIRGGLSLYIVYDEWNIHGALLWTLMTYGIAIVVLGIAMVCLIYLKNRYEIIERDYFVQVDEKQSGSKIIGVILLISSLIIMWLHVLLQMVMIDGATRDAVKYFVYLLGPTEVITITNIILVVASSRLLMTNSNKKYVIKGDNRNEQHTDVKRRDRGYM